MNIGLRMGLTIASVAVLIVVTFFINCEEAFKY